MPKNIVVCCDGTGNQIERNLSNVLKLFRILEKGSEQVVFYDPGIGTIGQHESWARLQQGARTYFGLATGQGLDENILDAYTFLMDHYQEGDQLYIFGFSRGAYTARALAGFLHLVGLLNSQQKNICHYALAAYKAANQNNDLKDAWHFSRVAGARRVLIKFLGVWDTVNSVIVPGSASKLFKPSFLALPYTATNPSVAVFRHALAIDECRRMFRVSHWNGDQRFVSNPFDKSAAKVKQDIKQVWFAGVHSDVGGGYPEVESALSKFPLIWMIEEAVTNGLKINRSMLNHLGYGMPREGSNHTYVKPDVLGQVHNSMAGFWPVLEYLPRRVSRREWKARSSFLGVYFPRSEPRLIEEGALIHWSSIAKSEADKSYRPINLPKNFVVEGKPGPECAL